MLLIARWFVLVLLFLPWIDSVTTKWRTQAWQEALFEAEEMARFVPDQFNGSLLRRRSFKRGELYRANMTTVDLQHRDQLEADCPGAGYTHFTACTGNFSNVLLWKSLLADANETAFAPHCIAVRNALMNWNGQVFDGQRYYAHGGCSDTSWDSYWHRTTFATYRLERFREPVVNLMHPYEGNVYHEVIDLYGMLISFIPLLLRFPRIKVLMGSRFQHSKYFPLLAAYGVNVSALNLHYLTDPRSMVSAPYIITSQMNTCCKILPSVAKVMRNALSAWPSRQPAGKQMLLYDRIADKTRQMRYADDVLELLGKAFPDHRVIRFFGNESLDRIISLFSGSSVVVGVHGAGLTNMIAMHAGSTVVEVRPENYELPCMQWLGMVSELRYHTFSCGKGRYKGIIPIVPTQLVDFVKKAVSGAS